MPLVLPLLPMALGAALGTGLELGFWIVMVGLGAISLGHSRMRLHRNGAPLKWFSAGLLVLLIARATPESEAALEAVAVTTAAALFITAHRKNLSLRRSFARSTSCEITCSER